jgi:hypothetical protein
MTDITAGDEKHTPCQHVSGTTAIGQMIFNGGTNTLSFGACEECKKSKQMPNPPSTTQNSASPLSTNTNAPTSTAAQASTSPAALNLFVDASVIVPGSFDRVVQSGAVKRVDSMRGAIFVVADKTSLGARLACDKGKRVLDPRAVMDPAIDWFNRLSLDPFYLDESQIVPRFDGHDRTPGSGSRWVKLKFPAFQNCRHDVSMYTLACTEKGAFAATLLPAQDAGLESLLCDAITEELGYEYHLTIVAYSALAWILSTIYTLLALFVFVLYTIGSGLGVGVGTFVGSSVLTATGMHIIRFSRLGRIDTSKARRGFVRRDRDALMRMLTCMLYIFLTVPALLSGSLMKPDGFHARTVRFAPVHRVVNGTSLLIGYNQIVDLAPGSDELPVNCLGTVENIRRPSELLNFTASAGVLAFFVPTPLPAEPLRAEIRCTLLLAKPLSAFLRVDAGLMSLDLPSVSHERTSVIPPWSASETKFMAFWNSGAFTAVVSRAIKWRLSR